MRRLTLATVSGVKCQDQDGPGQGRSPEHRGSDQSGNAGRNRSGQVGGGGVVIEVDRYGSEAVA